MLGAEGRLVDGQGPLQQRQGLPVASLGAETILLMPVFAAGMWWLTASGQLGDAGLGRGLQA